MTNSNILKESKKRQKHRLLRFHIDAFALIVVLSYGATNKIFSPNVALILGFFSYGIIQSEYEWAKAINKYDGIFSKQQIKLESIGRENG